MLKIFIDILSYALSAWIWIYTIREIIKEQKEKEDGYIVELSPAQSANYDNK